MDTLNRRLRDERQSTGKYKTTTWRSLLWFEKIHEHGPLPLNILHAFTAAKHPDITAASKHAGDLFHESNTEHNGPYLDRLELPLDNALAQYAVYSNTDRARQALADTGRLRDTGIEPDTFQGFKRASPHRFMTSCITASIELACIEQGLGYIPQWEIIARMPKRQKPLHIPVTISYNGQTISKPVVPDAIFGITYQDGSMRTFCLEADRANEPISVPQLSRTSFMRKALQYKELIGRGIYKAHFGMTKMPMQAIFVTTILNHQIGMIEEAKRVLGSNQYMLFATASDFGRNRIRRIPPPLKQLLTIPYRTVDGTFDISKP
jgi:hypothetical protein